MPEQLLLFDEKRNASVEIVRDFMNIAGLVYCEEFLSKAEQELALQAVDSREWRNDLKRRVQHYGFRYDYKTRRVDTSMFLGTLPPFAEGIARKLVSLGMISRQPDQMIVNEYEAGQGITPHVDCEPCFEDEIATISLGDLYTMDMRNVASKEQVHIPLPVGSCLVFCGEARFEWTHGIKARLTENGRKRQRRVSLTFRKVILNEKATAKR